MMTTVYLPASPYIPAGWYVRVMAGSCVRLYGPFVTRKLAQAAEAEMVALSKPEWLGRQSAKDSTR